jgi:monooxygenase
VILEARAASGGTWDLFRYPGVRSDSDLHTYGYSFKPWLDRRAFAGGQAILDYIRATAAEHGIDRRIRYGHHATGAAWDSSGAVWTVEAFDRTAEESLRFTCSWLVSACGYYRYDHGHRLELAGADRFAGEIVHPQQWPTELDHTDKRVVVIGSGATAVTLVPAMAQRARHVTMVQRSPTYMITLATEDPIAGALTRVLPAQRAFAITRAKNVLLQSGIYRLSRRRPALLRELLLRGVRRRLPAGYDVGRHFTPTYQPWDQRLCVVPDGDLFKQIAVGRVSVVTDTVAGLTEGGVLLGSGAKLDADLVVTATGLELLAFGGIELTVDGHNVALKETLAYKGVMLGDVPNFAFVVGYTNASWTLKVDLAADWLCRVIGFMDEHAYASATPFNRDRSMVKRPLLELRAGYVERALDRLPRQGTGPWSMNQSYRADVRRLRREPITDGVLRFMVAPSGARRSRSGTAPTSRPAHTG